MPGFYKVPQVVREDIQVLDRQIEHFKRGEVSPAKFRGFRVPLGIYEQRQENTYMMRVRIPGGGITPFQLKELARLAQEYKTKLHLTTRQDIQLQNVELDCLVPLYRELYRAGLTCKGGGGNTVRNITACPEAGICPDELFDTLPYAIGLTEYFIQFPSSYNLPRKFKIAFSGCSKDCALATVNDLGFIAKSQNGEIGFSVYIAGGMGNQPRVAEHLFNFVPASEIGYVAEAAKRLFDKHGDRKNKNRARLRFVIEKLGPEVFRQFYNQELEKVKEEGPIELDLREVKEERSNQPRPSEDEERLPGNDDKYSKWKKEQVRKQKQDGFYMVRIPVPLGDIEPEKLEGVADLVEKIGGSSLHLNQTQDLLVPWMREEDLSSLYNGLKELDLADSYSNINYLVCCKGAATCKLGLCLSQGLAGALAEALDEAGIYLSDLSDLNFRINGCPNACGQHPVGTIGLHGGARRIGGRLAPHYNVLVGGFVEEGKTKLARPLGYVPAKNIPQLIRDFLKIYLERRSPSLGFLEFVEQGGEEILKDLLEKYQTVPPYEESPEFYFDWSSNEEFSLAGRGPGECGAGVLDMIEADLQEASAAYDRYQKTETVSELYKTVVHLSKSLLVTRGLDPRDDWEAFQQFRDNFIESGWVSRKYQEVLEAARAYQEEGKAEGLPHSQALILSLVERIRALYESMDSNLQFQIELEEKQVEKGLAEEKPEAKVFLLDLRGTPCPINFVKTKLKLDELEQGEILEVLLDEGEPIQNVPRSVRDDGHKILKVEQEGEFFRVAIEKAEGR